MEAKKAPSTKTKKDAALEALRESGKTYRSIFEHSSVPMMIIEKDSTISLTNNKFSEMSGFRRTDVGGKKKWMDLVAPQDIEKLTNCFNDMKKTKDGSTRHLIVDFLDRKKAIHRVSLNVTVIPGTSRIIASFDQIRD
jgi:PAS domain S-box-containing protein